MTKNNVETNKGETEENEEKMGQPWNIIIKGTRKWREL
jgi:hypothetical protein